MSDEFEIAGSLTTEQKIRSDALFQAIGLCRDAVGTIDERVQIIMKAARVFNEFLQNG